MNKNDGKNKEKNFIEKYKNTIIVSVLLLVIILGSIFITTMKKIKTKNIHIMNLLKIYLKIQ